MKYDQPSGVEKAKAEEVFLRGSHDEICETIVAIALNSDDAVWAQEKCLELSQHREWSIRAVAATCLGHLARIHRVLDLSKVLPRLRELDEDARTAGYAEGALSDIEIFMPDELKRFMPDRL